MKSIKYINYISESTKNILLCKKLSTDLYTQLWDIKRILTRYGRDYEIAKWWLAYFNEHPYAISSSGDRGNLIESPAAVMIKDLESDAHVYEANFRTWKYNLGKGEERFLNRPIVWEKTFLKKSPMHYKRYFNHGY